MEWEGCGIFDDAGRVVELQAIGRDITQDHEVAEALRASEARYRGVVESNKRWCCASTSSGASPS